jgi:hypothetical protein
MDRVALLGLPRGILSGLPLDTGTSTYLVEVDFIAEQLHLLRHALDLFFDLLSIGKIVDLDALGSVPQTILLHRVGVLSLLYRLLSLHRLRLADLSRKAVLSQILMKNARLTHSKLLAMSRLQRGRVSRLEYVSHDCALEWSLSMSSSRLSCLLMRRLQDRNDLSGSPMPLYSLADPRWHLTAASAPFLILCRIFPEAPRHPLKRERSTEVPCA